jgi:hypothetical protein
MQLLRDGLEDDSIGSLDEAFGLGVSYWSEAYVNAQLLAKFFEEVTVKLGVVVHDKQLGYSEVAYDLLPKVFLTTYEVIVAWLLSILWSTLLWQLCSEGFSVQLVAVRWGPWPTFTGAMVGRWGLSKCQAYWSERRCASSPHLSESFSNEGPWLVVGSTCTFMDFFKFLITFASSDTIEERRCDTGFE